MVNWNTEQILMQKQDKIKACLNLRRYLFSWLLSPMSVNSLIQIPLVFTIMSIFLHIHIQTCLRNLIFNPFGSEFPSISAFTVKHLRCHAREGLAAVSQSVLTWGSLGIRLTREWKPFHPAQPVSNGNTSGKTVIKTQLTLFSLWKYYKLQELT